MVDIVREVLAILLHGDHLENVQVVLILVVIQEHSTLVMVLTFDNEVMVMSLHVPV